MNIRTTLTTTTTDTSVAASTTAAVAVADGRSARWSSHREERRRELIRAARRAVHTLGPEASMDDIANAASTSKSVFYRYFGDKAGLQQAVGEVVLHQMRQKIVDAAQGAEGPQEALHAMVSAYLHMAQTSPNVYTFVTKRGNLDSSSTVGSPLGGAFSHFFDAITQMLAKPMQDYFSGNSSALIAYWPTAAIGLVRAAGEEWLSATASQPQADPDSMATRITGWLLHGIAHELSTPLSNSAMTNQPS
ncbi:TetR/AcrR family transcriptional regulator [Pseudarthrobacter sp. J1738]|uniref:TetR/AcrR family transcriptional regulator n=1 Tax=Pseudarthrobacter sp. J1738 TaxID=3420446 RepID=UPI003D2B2E03